MPRKKIHGYRIPTSIMVEFELKKRIDDYGHNLTSLVNSALREMFFDMNEYICPVCEAKFTGAVLMKKANLCPNCNTKLKRKIIMVVDNGTVAKQ